MRRRASLGRGPGAFRRKPVSVAAQDLVEIEPWATDRKLPLLIRPARQGVDLMSWVASHRDVLDGHLARNGALLFRGFDLQGPAALESFIRSVGGDPLAYKERSSPRHAVAGRIYTSTDYPPEHSIFLHNENSYQNTWPMRIFFFCHVEPEEGGETPLADTRRIYDAIDLEVRERLVRKGWMYIRNFGDGFGLDWKTVFQTEDPKEVETYCRSNGVEIEWRDEGRLRTRAVRRAAVPHPVTGEMVWFNHATFFHVSTLAEEIREPLLARFGTEDLPVNTYYGDGSEIEPEVLDHLRSVYEAETVRFSWQAGDLLIVDNMMVAHGRAPYRGRRQILVGMSDPCTWEDLVA